MTFPKPGAQPKRSTLWEPLFRGEAVLEGTERVQAAIVLYAAGWQMRLDDELGFGTQTSF
jgi:hypothetical protein